MFTRKCRWTMALLIGALAFGQQANEDFFTAARQGDAASVKAALDKGVPVDAQWRYGMTALLIASTRGHTEVVRLLIERGADVNVKDTFYGQTALGAAAQKNHTETVRLLLAKGARERDGVVMASVFNKNVDMLKAALEGGGVKQETLDEALARARSFNNAALAELLVSAGAKEMPKADFQVDPATLARYAGSYRNESGGELTLAVKDGKLQGGPPGQNGVFNAFDATTFQPEGAFGMKVVFNVDASGAVTGLTVNSRGNKQEFKRVEPKVEKP